MMNILAAVYFALHFSFAVIMSEINPTVHNSITTRYFPDKCFLAKFVKLFMNLLSLNGKKL